MSEKSKILKNLIMSNKTEYILECHNPISAIIAEQSGFKGVWGSSLTFSASMGQRDVSELSFSDTLKLCFNINESINVPLLLDIDSGYGDFNNTRTVVSKAEKIGVSGVCIEDKLFPKTNSYIQSEKQKLESTEVFCGKLKAIKDTIKDKDFCLIARTEAIVVGLGVDEAIKRANTYVDCGADAIFVHSKNKDICEIAEFMKKWNRNIPIVISPTSYEYTKSKIYEELGISLVIWANYMLRASVFNMQKISKKLFKSQSISNIKDDIVNINEIFRLQNMDELLEARKLYSKVEFKS